MAIWGLLLSGRFLFENHFYLPSPEYPVACCYRDEWRGETRRSSKSEGWLVSVMEDVVLRYTWFLS